MRAYARDENTSAGLCAKNAGGAYARGGAYLRDTTVGTSCHYSIRYKVVATQASAYEFQGYVTNTGCQVITLFKHTVEERPCSTKATST